MLNAYLRMVLSSGWIKMRESTIEEKLDSDGIDSVEAGFMQGEEAAKDYYKMEEDEQDKEEDE